MAANKHIGSDLDDLLIAKDILADAQAKGFKQLLVFQMAVAMAKAEMSRTALAKKMHVSPSVVKRLLDPHDQSTTLKTLSQAATALNMKLLVAMDAID